MNGDSIGVFGFDSGINDDNRVVLMSELLIVKYCRLNTAISEHFFCVMCCTEFLELNLTRL